MNRKALESLDKEALIDMVLTLAARVAELEAKLGLPPKTPDNSSTPSSQGRSRRPIRLRAGVKAHAHRILGRIVRCILIRCAGAIFWPINVDIAGPTCRAARRRRSTPTTTSRFRRSSRTSRG